MCDGEGLGLIQMAMTPMGLAAMAAIAGIGMKTQLRELANVGLRPVALMVGESVFLVVLVLVLQRTLA